MTSLLHVSVSSRASASFSRRAATRVIARLAERGPLSVIDRDLAAQPIPHPDRATVEASLMRPESRGPAERAALALSETLIGELEAAEQVLVSTPMHNFTVPSALKAWIDLVVRPGRTFLSTPTGKVGLLRDRPVVVVVACGGRLGGGPDGQKDFLTAYVKHVFATIGVRRTTVVKVERTNGGPEHVERGLEAADAAVDALL